MFETQDMLPRMPPMPSAPVNEIALKPTVPELSIIFGKPEAPSTNHANVQPSAVPPSYAAWKKQNLPRVTFPPNLKTEASFMPAVSSPGYITTRSSVYPMRTVTIPTTAAPAIYTSTATTVDKPFRHDQENAQILTLSTPPIASSHSPFILKSEQRRSMDSLSSEAVLTICASTQTDNTNMPESSLKELFKQEFGQLIGIIKDLRKEQHRMREMMESFLIQQTHQNQPNMPVYCCDKATQCEANENGSGTVGARNASLENLPPYNVETECGTLHRALPNVKIYSPITKETPRLTKPVAQSTTYRGNTPLNMRQNGTVGTQPANLYVQNMPALPKPNTERSMVMNELALKYLPSEKLTELLQDAQISAGENSTKRAVPLRENDNFNKAPTDISNASYKYLRKYRLLPDHNANSPIENGQQTSPYQHRVQDTPISNGSSAASADSPHLDLEHIRRQPKFL